MMLPPWFTGPRSGATSRGGDFKMCSLTPARYGALNRSFTIATRRGAPRVTKLSYCKTDEGEYARSLSWGFELPLAEVLALGAGC